MTQMPFYNDANVSIATTKRDKKHLQYVLYLHCGCQYKNFVCTAKNHTVLFK